MWYSAPDFRDCVADCEEGYAYYASGANETCVQCARPACALDELLVPCARSRDAYCVACPDPLPANHEFYLAGTCLTRCAKGHAGAECLPCSGIACPPGQDLNSSCADPADRLRLPGCAPCPTLDRRVFLPGQGCATQCAAGWMEAPDGACVDCNASACPLAYQGYCAGGRVQCVPCPSRLPDRVRTAYAAPGNCTVVCAPPYAGPLCLPPPSSPQDVPSTQGAPPAVWGVAALPRNETDGFPVRSLPHS